MDVHLLKSLFAVLWGIYFARVLLVRLLPSFAFFFYFNAR